MVSVCLLRLWIRVEDVEAADEGMVDQSCMEEAEDAAADVEVLLVLVMKWVHPPWVEDVEAAGVEAAEAEEAEEAEVSAELVEDVEAADTIKYVNV